MLLMFNLKCAEVRPWGDVYNFILILIAFTLFIKMLHATSYVWFHQNCLITHWLTSAGHWPWKLSLGCGMSFVLWERSKEWKKTKQNYVPLNSTMTHQPIWIVNLAERLVQWSEDQLCSFLTAIASWLEAEVWSHDTLLEKCGYFLFGLVKVDK